MSNFTKPHAEPKPPTPAQRVAHRHLHECTEWAQKAQQYQDDYEKAVKNGQAELAADTLDRLKIAQCEAYAFEAGTDAVLAEGKKVAEAEEQERIAAAKEAAEARAKAGPREPMSVRS